MLYTINIRVMYLYHYLVPLIFSLVLAPLIIDYFFGEKLEEELQIELKNTPFKVYLGLVLTVVLILACYTFFAPFTYHLPLNETQFNQRNWFNFWGLKQGKVK